MITSNISGNFGVLWGTKKIFPEKNLYEKKATKLAVTQTEYILLNNEHLLRNRD